MKFTTIIRSGLVALAFGTLSGTANATPVVIDGTLYTVPGGITNDLYTITVTTAGTVTFDVLSWENGDTDLNGDGEIAFFDPYIHLYNAAGTSLLAANDDSSSTFGDGSISALDSFMSVFLSVGTYLFAIGDYPLSAFDPLDGIQNSGGNFYGSGFASINYGDYRLTINGALVDGYGVPAPGALALLGFGLIGLGAARRRKA